jgi:hypothetical protein
LHKGVTILGIELDFSTINHVKVVGTLALPIHRIIFVELHFLTDLSNLPNELVVLTLGQKIDTFNQATKLVVENFFFETCRELF